MDDNHNKLTDLDERSSNNQEVEFPKSLRQKFFERKHHSSSKFINPRKQDVITKSQKDEERMAKVKSVYTDAFSNKKLAMNSSKKNFSEEASKAYKN